MQVRELIERLQQMDPDLRVVTPGYEGGYNDVSTIMDIELVLNHNDSPYYGPHEEVSSVWYEDGEEDTGPRAMAVLIR